MELNATLIGQMITFAVFVWFTMKFVWPLLDANLKARQEKIAEGLQAAERGHKELEISQKFAVKQIHDAREAAKHLIEQAKRESADLIEEAKNIAHKEREKIIEQGMKELQFQERLAKQKLKEEAGTFAVLTAEKLLGRSISEQDQQAFLNKGDTILE